MNELTEVGKEVLVEAKVGAARKGVASPSVIEGVSEKKLVGVGGRGDDVGKTTEGVVEDG